LGGIPRIDRQALQAHEVRGSAPKNGRRKRIRVFNPRERPASVSPRHGLGIRWIRDRSPRRARRNERVSAWRARQQPARFPRSVSTAASVISGCNADFVLVCGLCYAALRWRLVYNHCGVARPVHFSAGAGVEMEPDAHLVASTHRWRSP
jgi:hypothetical protein